MIWERLILWAVNRGMISGAIVGALLGVLIGFLYGALIGFFIGGIIGAFMGLIDGVLLAIVIRFAYTPPNIPSRYPKLVYSVAILTNSVPIFLLCGGLDFRWSIIHFSLTDTLIRLILIGGIPTVIMGFITAYMTGLFLEYVDMFKGYMSSYNPPETNLSHIEN